MAGAGIVLGALLGGLTTLWIVLLLGKLAVGIMVPPARRPAAPLWRLCGEVIEGPVNAVRWALPTVYRKVDLAPWMTLLLLMLFKTFITRALVYWGMLHRPTL